jgi:transcriptional regulator with XRE-family HTH domain
MQVGRNILFYLNEKGRTQVDLAKALGSSKQIVHKIIKGTKALRIEELVAISEYLNITLDDVVLGEKNLETDKDVPHLFNEIKNQETAKFILTLINNLSVMEDELAANNYKY